MINNNQEADVEELEKHAVIDLLDYSPDSVVSKTIIKKTTGDVTVYSVSEGKAVGEKFLPFATYIQVIDGTASFIINKSNYLIAKGQGIIIPAHIKHHINAGARFTMIVTVIKSGYEE
jgi:quercetin dioxygenase-like cupin family protein